jgi:hypothetical protein
MALPPPPAPDNDMRQQQQQPQQQQEAPGLFLPVDKIMGFAKQYAKMHGIVKWAARMGGYKIPKEIDDFINDLNNEGTTPENLQKAQQALTNGQMQMPGQWNRPGPGRQYFDPGEGYYDDEQQGPRQLPAPRIGERSLTHDLAYKAWEMNHRYPIGHKEYMSSRDIAAYFTQELGYPISHTAVNDYINEVDDEMQEAERTRKSAVWKGVFMVAVPTALAFLVGQIVPKVI